MITHSRAHMIEPSKKEKPARKDVIYEDADSVLFRIMRDEKRLETIWGLKMNGRVTDMMPVSERDAKILKEMTLAARRGDEKKAIKLSQEFQRVTLKESRRDHGAKNRH